LAGSSRIASGALLAYEFFWFVNTIEHPNHYAVALLFSRLKSSAPIDALAKRRPKAISNNICERIDVSLSKPAVLNASTYKVQVAVEYATEPSSPCSDHDSEEATVVS